jgi:hypothetical protein
MNRSGFSGLVLAGALLVLLGIAGLAMPSFTTQQTNTVAKVGDLKLQSKQDNPHFIPPLLSEGAIAVGALLLAAGFFRRT